MLGKRRIPWVLVPNAGAIRIPAAPPQNGAAFHTGGFALTTRLASAVVAVVLAVGAGIATYAIQDHGPVEVTALTKEIFDDSELNVINP